MDDINFTHTHVNGYEFRAGFMQAILQGTLTQTIRKVESGAHTPVAGEKILGWVAKGDNAAHLVLDTLITDVQQLYFDFTGAHEPVALDGRILTRSEREIFAMDCGFRDFKSLAMFVLDQYGHNPFRAYLIKWEGK